MVGISFVFTDVVRRRSTMPENAPSPFHVEPKHDDD